MRILIISNLKENGYGESTRPYHLGRAFGEMGHEVLNICDRTGREGNVRFFKRTLFGETPSFLKQKWDFLRLLLASRMFNPDIIYVHQLNNWTWARLSRALPKAVRVFDAHTSVHFEFSSFGSSEKGLKTTYEREKNALLESDHVITVSKETKALFERNFKVDPLKMSIVKNATFLKPVAALSLPENGAKFICSALLPQDGFESNRLALEMLLDVALEMEKVDPSVQFVVVGGGQKPLTRSGNVAYAGFVPDLKDGLATADVCLMTYPPAAVCGGVRNKVCDYFALAKPVISTAEGMRGFDDCQPETHFILAESVDDTVKAILRTKDNAELRNALAEAALAKAADYQWPNRAQEVITIFERLV